MTILETERLVRKILEARKEPSRVAGASKLAQDYADACRAANLRLQQCEAMIRERSRHPAIQAAETAPNLLDWIAILEFQGAGDWRDACEKNGLPVAERIDARSVAVLNECYAQGISTDHPLYAAFRRAVLTHNDEEALRALQSIVRLNPADTNALGELDRFDRKVLAARLRQLEDLLAGAAPEVVVAQVEAIEAFGFKSPLEGDVWRRAQSLRCAALLEEIARLRSEGNWSDALAKLELIQRLRQALNVELSTALADQLSDLQAWANAALAEKNARARFQAGMEALRRQLQDLEGGAPALRQMPASRVRDAIEELRRLMGGLAHRQSEIPQSLSDAFQKQLAGLAGELDRRKRVRQRKSLAMSALGVIALAGIAAVGFVYVNARKLARELDAAVSERNLSAALRLRDAADASVGMRIGLGGLPAAKTAADSFVSRERDLRRVFDEDWAKLPRELRGEPTASGLKAISEQLARAKGALSALGPATRSEYDPRVNAFDRQWSNYLAGSTSAVNGVFERAVIEAENQNMRLSYQLALDQARTGAQVFSNQVRRLGDYEAGFTNHLAIRGDLLERSAAVRGKFAAYDAEVRKLDEARAALKQARGMSGYSNALFAISTSRFTAPWANAAAAVRELEPGEEKALRQLLAATNDVAWEYVRRDQLPSLIPNQALSAEQQIFDRLHESPAVNGNHQRVRLLLDAQGQKTMEWITSGPLGKVAQWKTIDTYDPAASPDVCAFESRQYGFFDGKYKWSPPLRDTVFDIQWVADLHDAAAFHAIDPEHALGSEHPSKPLLEVMDALKDSREGSPVFRAYLFQRLSEIMELQPARRGLAFAPEIRTHADRLKGIAGGSLAEGDWFLPGRAAALAPKLEECFVSFRGVSYPKQAAGTHRLSHEAYRAGLRYFGFIDIDGNVNAADKSYQGEIWGYAAKGSPPELLGRKSAAGTELGKKGLPLSPLFTLGASRAELIDRAGVDIRDPSFTNALPPLFAAPSGRKAAP
jgi:hypothetical protein